MAVELKVLEPYFESVIRDVTGDPVVHRDPDGDVPFRLPHAFAFVRLAQGPTNEPTVRVFSVLRTEIPSSPALFESLNRLNTTSMFLKFAWDAGAVVAATDIRAASLQAEDVRLALEGIDAYSTELDTLLGIPSVTPPTPQSHSTGEGHAEERTENAPASESAGGKQPALDVPGYL